MTKSGQKWPNSDTVYNLYGTVRSYFERVYFMKDGSWMKKLVYESLTWLMLRLSDYESLLWVIFMLKMDIDWPDLRLAGICTLLWRLPGIFVLIHRHKSATYLSHVLPPCSYDSYHNCDLFEIHVTSFCLRNNPDRCLISLKWVKILRYNILRSTCTWLWYLDMWIHPCISSNGNFYCLKIIFSKLQSSNYDI